MRISDWSSDVCSSDLVPAGEDHLLDGLRSPIPICADESCQDHGDLPRLAGRYQAINIKLDKCGGLTEALKLAAQASAAGMQIMTGCMLSTSLGIAPALLAAQTSRWVRSEERRVGQECVSACRSRWSPY